MKDFSSKWIKVSEPYPHVLHVELSRAPVNAFCTVFWKAYGELFDRLGEEGPDVRAVVLSSAFPKIFTAGIDLADAAGIANFSEGGYTDNARVAFNLEKHIKEFQNAIGAPERFPFPVIAAIHGMTLGLGVDMTAACDIRYAASNTKFTIKEVDIGLAADIGTLAYLPKITGNMSLVREMAYSARWFSAADAEKMGLVSKVVEGGREEVITAALSLAKDIAAKSPIAVAGTKRLLMHSRDHSVAENLEYTAVWNSAMLQTKDMMESLAATKGKRAANFPPVRKVPSKL